jgi:hypothetical protein
VSNTRQETKPTWQSYDDEFKYDESIESRIPELMAQMENERVESNSSQSAEEYWRLYEANVEARKAHRWQQQDEFKMRREGRILHMNEFLRLLRSAGLNAWYTDRGGMPGTLGLFVAHSGYYPSCGHKRNEPHYVAFVQVPLMQEYEELYFDRYDIPLGSKRRGWRTVLLRLIDQRLLTEEKAHEIFGKPDVNVVSRRYLHFLQYLRNRPI